MTKETGSSTRSSGASNADACGSRKASHRSAAGSAQIGVLGWIIVVPTLIGLFLGRWLDHAFQSELFWTGPLLLLGLALGCWSAWKWVNSA